MIIDNICAKRTYTDKAGAEKVKWLNVGILKTTDKGMRFIELYMFPDTAFYVFEKRDKADSVESTPFDA